MDRLLLFLSFLGLCRRSIFLCRMRFLRIFEYCSYLFGFENWLGSCWELKELKEGLEWVGRLYIGLMDLFGFGLDFGGNNDGQ